MKRLVVALILSCSILSSNCEAAPVLVQGPSICVTAGNVTNAVEISALDSHGHAMDITSGALTRSSGGYGVPFYVLVGGKNTGSWQWANLLLGE